MTSKVYNVKFTLVMNEDVEHPREWLANAIWRNLVITDERIVGLELVEVEEKVVSNNPPCVL